MTAVVEGCKTFHGDFGILVHCCKNREKKQRGREEAEKRETKHVQNSFWTNQNLATKHVFGEAPSLLGN